MLRQRKVAFCVLRGFLYSLRHAQLLYVLEIKKYILNIFYHANKVFRKSISSIVLHTFLIRRKSPQGSQALSIASRGLRHRQFLFYRILLQRIFHQPWVVPSTQSPRNQRFGLIARTQIHFTHKYLKDDDKNHDTNFKTKNHQMHAWTNAFCLESHPAKNVKYSASAACASEEFPGFSRNTCQIKENTL